MLTIERLAKIDSLALRIITALHRGIEWVGDQHGALIVSAAYKVVEAKASAIDKAEDKISDIEDDSAELVAYGVEARTILQRRHREALEALTREIEAKEDKLSAAHAAAAEELVATIKAYDQTVDAAREKLGVGIEA